MSVQRTESETEKHTRLARQLMEDARREIAAGDTVQGGEKLWGATQHALKAYCASHNLPHGKYGHRRRAVLDLSEQLGNPFLRVTFGIAQSCHGNFYNDWLEQEDLDTYLPDIEELVNIVLSQKAE